MAYQVASSRVHLLWFGVVHPWCDPSVPFNFELDAIVTESDSEMATGRFAFNLMSTGSRWPARWRANLNCFPSPPLPLATGAQRATTKVGQLTRLSGKAKMALLVSAILRKTNDSPVQRAPTAVPERSANFDAPPPPLPAPHVLLGPPSGGWCK